MKDQTIFHQVIILLNHSHNVSFRDVLIIVRRKLMLVSLGTKSNHSKCKELVVYSM